MEVNLEEEMNDTGVITQTQTNDNKLLRQETTKNNGDAVNESFNNNLEMLTADDVKLLTRLDEANLLDNNENSLSALSELLLEQKHTIKPATTSTLPPIGVSPVYSPSSTTMVTTPEAMTVESPSPGPSPKMNPPEKRHVKFHSNGGKPMDLNKRMKSSSKARPKAAVVYQSQVRIKKTL